MIVWHPKSSFPIRNLLFGLLRIAADSSPIIILVPSLLFVTAGEAAFVILTCVLVLGGAIMAQLNARTAFNLTELRHLVESRDKIGVFSIGDYMAEVGLRAPPLIERFGRPVKGNYCILRLPRCPGFSAYQYAPRRSVICVPFRPEEMTLGRLGGLLHELGHIGIRNWLTSTAHAVTHPEVVQAANQSLLSLMKAQLGSNNRRRLRFQGNETISAFTAIFLFVHDIAAFRFLLVLFTLLLVMNFSAKLRVAGARLEAEIEADQYQWQAMTRIRSLAGRHPMFREEKIPQVPVKIVDRLLDEQDNSVRNSTLAIIRDHAAGRLIQPTDFYLWRGAFQIASVFAIIRLALACIAALVVGHHEIQFVPWLLASYALVGPLLLARSYLKRRDSLRKLGSAIAARDDTQCPSGRLKL